MLTMNQDTLPGWVIALAWLVYLLWLWICFKEPTNKNEGNLVSYQTNAGMLTRLLVFSMLYGSHFYLLSIPVLDERLGVGIQSYELFSVYALRATIS